MGQLMPVTLRSGAIDASGDATAYTNIPVRGIIRAIKVIYSGTHDMTVDLYEMNPADPDDVSDALQHILDLAASGATPAADNIVYYPHRAAEDYTGTSLYFEATDAKIVPVPFVVNGVIGIDVNSGTAGESVKVEIIVEEY